MKKIVCWLKGHLVIEWEHLNDYDAPLYFKGTVVLRQPYCGRCGAYKIWSRKHDAAEALSLRPSHN